ncbi:MAG TPA: hypothetical protein VHR47_05150 [Bacillota bacterium]|nr:hypothetical protein [Bacillota bacterium]
MAGFFQTLHRNSIFHSWQESRRKSITGWILLSMGGVFLGLSFLFIQYSLPLVIVAAIAILLGVFFIIKGKIDWIQMQKSFEPTDNLTLLDIFNRKIQSLPFVVVYESEDPSKAAAIFTLNHSYILPFAITGDMTNVTANFSDQINRLLPSPWQQTSILEPVHNAMELEAAIHRIIEESPNTSITLTLLETVAQFAKVICSFIIIGRPLPQFDNINQAKQETSVTTQQPSKPKRIKQQKPSVSFGFDLRRFKWLIKLCVLIGIGYGLYYFSTQTGPKPGTTYLDEIKIWVSMNLPLEYHSYFGIGTLQDDVEPSIIAFTPRSTYAFDKVGGGQVLARLAKQTELNVIQEELVNGIYWYYIQKDNTSGWVRNHDLVFKHLLSAKSKIYRFPIDTESELSPDRAIPFAVRQKYTANGEEWLGISGFAPINDVVWIRRGDYK